MTVDDSTSLDAGQNRNSVRISSKKAYNDALIIAHIERMPHGCSVWPAWWTVGGDWPNNGENSVQLVSGFSTSNDCFSGEVDIVEGVHNQEANQYTYHTGPGCTLDDSVKMTANILNTECTVGGGNNRGCGMTDQSGASYGESFNQGGGGVFAQLRDSEGIRIWFFPRDSIPEDITSNAPQPSTWDTPASFLANGDKCPVETHFVDHVLTFDITLCGQWAGDEQGFKDAGCPGSCAETVQNPENYKNAKWKVRYVATYTIDGGGED
ncbi:hypothetical protein BDZ89DRAFT_25084 [Hymenopellis radicata]|nr:hypothetical protein BDZ89DRAFT_25084 [Hymenopellis radicata]